MKKHPDPNWITVNQAVQMTGKSLRTIQQYISTGKIASKKVFGSRLISLKSIQDALDGKQ